MTFDQLLRRHFWAVLVPLTGAAAFFEAEALTELASGHLLVGVEELSATPLSARVNPPSSNAEPGAGSHVNSASAIIDRNPFDSVTKLKAPEVAEVASAAPDMSDPSKAPPCEGAKVLVIVDVAPPQESVAAFSGSDGKVLVRKVCRDKPCGDRDEVNGKKMVHIQWDRVWLTQGSQLCYAPLFKQAQGGGPAAPVSTPPPSGGGGSGASAVPPDIMKGIVKVREGEFNVDRSVVDKILENQAELMKTARIVPEQENGKVVGIRLFGIKPDTLLGVLGLQTGDRLEKINGFDMASPEKALEAYARLRTADKLAVQINRNGQPTTLDFNIK